MDELKVFNFEEQEVRMRVVDGEPWFVANDVCKYFGVTNRNRVLQKLEDEEKGGTRMDTPGGSQDLTIINESGLYSLLFALEPRQARGISEDEVEKKYQKVRKFKRWVTSEVLPSIRKHGGYLTPEKIEEALLNPDTLIQLATTLKDERTKRLLAEQRVNELQPKADYYDSILRNKSLMTISVIAKNYGMSANGMNKLLHELGVQYQHSKTWLLYSKHQDKGYTHTEMIPVQGSDNLKPSTKWTQKGHIFIYQLLKKNNVLPLIEKKDIA